MAEQFSEQELHALFRKHMPLRPMPTDLADRLKQQVLAEVANTIKASQLGEAPAAVESSTAIKPVERTSRSRARRAPAAQAGIWARFAALFRLAPSLALAGGSLAVLLLLVFGGPRLIPLIAEYVNPPTITQPGTVLPLDTATPVAPTPELTAQLAVSETVPTATPGENSSEASPIEPTFTVETPLVAEENGGPTVEDPTPPLADDTPTDTTEPTAPATEEQAAAIVMAVSATPDATDTLAAPNASNPVPSTNSSTRTPTSTPASIALAPTTAEADKIPTVTKQATPSNSGFGTSPVVPTLTRTATPRPTWTATRELETQPGAAVTRATATTMPTRTATRMATRTAVPAVTRTATPTRNPAVTIFATATATPTPTKANGQPATPTFTTTPDSSVGALRTPEVTPIPPTPLPTNTPTATPTNTPLPTNTPTPTATNTLPPPPTNTPVPPPTNTPVPPPPTDTPVPPPTNTPVPPPPTDTPVPPPTNTPVPPPTDTPVPPPTNTPVPPPTDTPVPPPTNTPVPPPTHTPVPPPTATNTPVPPPTPTPVNNVPGFISQPVTEMDEGQGYSYRVLVADPDQDDLLIVQLAEGHPDWLEVVNGSDRTAELRCVAAGCGPAGTYTVVLTVNDGKTSASQTFELVVKAVAIPPVFDSQPITTAFVGQQYSYPIRASDPGGGSVVVRAIDIPPWFALTAENVLISTRNPDITEVGGVYTVLLEATDPQGLSTRQQFSITIANYQN